MAAKIAEYQLAKTAIVYVLQYSFFPMTFDRIIKTNVCSVYKLAALRRAMRTLDSEGKVEVALGYDKRLVWKLKER